jgi:FtsZ-binding cell division protein ZapB
MSDPDFWFKKYQAREALHADQMHTWCRTLETLKASHRTEIESLQKSKDTLQKEITTLATRNDALVRENGEMKLQYQNVLAERDLLYKELDCVDRVLRAGIIGISKTTEQQGPVGDVSTYDADLKARDDGPASGRR